MTESVEKKFYLGGGLIARCYPDKNKKRKWEICSPHDLMILGYDEEIWIFLEDGTRDSEIRTIKDLLEIVYGKDTIDRIKRKEL